MRSEEFEFRKYRTGDELMIAEFRKSFPPLERKKNDAVYYSWKFGDNPVCEPEVWLAEDKGQMIGLLAAIPKRLKYKGKTLMGAELGDAYVLREYQGENIFKRLGEKVFAGLEKKGIHLIYGIPNDIALPIWKRKFGMKTPFSLVKMVRVLKTENLLAKKIKSRFLVSFLAWPANLALKSLNWIISFSISRPHLSFEKLNLANDESLPSILCDCFDFSLEKNKDYLKWRYTRAPEHYDLYLIKDGRQNLGMAVTAERVEKNLKTGYIVDLFLVNKTYLGCIIEALVKMFSNKSLDMVLFWTTRENFYFGEFKRKLFFGFLGGVHFILKNNLDENEEGKYNFDRRTYYLNIGDTDNI